MKLKLTLHTRTLQ